MDAPPEHESVEGFARVAAALDGLGINVPRVLATDAGHGFALLSDLGDRTYLDALNEHNADALYADALDALERLQRGSRGRIEEFEAYDADKLTAEMELFRQWFVPHRTRGLPPRGDAVIDDTFRILRDNALEQPLVWVHRDYHSRNLMVTAENNPGVLDFQDAVSGPVTYDLVSLLRDCYITWPGERTEAWLNAYFERIRGHVVDTDIGAAQFRRWFDWMGVQRHVKVLGIFARLYHRDGKAAYLDDLPVVFAYVREVCARYPELQAFDDLLSALEIKWKR